MAGKRGRLIFAVGVIVAVAALAVGLTLRRDSGEPVGSAASAAEAPGPPIPVKVPTGRAVVIAPSASCRASADPKAPIALRLGRGDMIGAAGRSGGWTRLKEGAFDCWLPDRLLQFG